LWLSCVVVIGDGEGSGRAKVLDNLANLLAAKTANGASSATYGEGRQPDPHGEMQYKLDLMPNEIKLDGFGRGR
jgi:hypothetical protein